MALQPCPSREVLAGYLLGKLPEEVVEEIAEHVDNCAACESALPSLSDPSDTLLPRLRQPVPDDPAPEEAVPRQLLAQAKSLGSEPFAPGSAAAVAGGVDGQESTDLG